MITTKLTNLAKSLDILNHNRKYMPGGVSSVNRLTAPPIVFTRAEGAYMWDADGNRYVDYHAAFGPYFLGHNHPRINAAVEEVFRCGASLFGSGTTVLEGKLAELLCTHIPTLDRVAILNTGSEATSAAIRLARAFTGRDHLIVMQGGYNGQNDGLCCNVMNSLSEIGARVSPGEYKYIPMGAGTPSYQAHFTHVVNFNDPDSVRYICGRHEVAALITEPVLQNVGVVRPLPGYLETLRALADEYGFVLIFDEVKTGFRHALGGFSEVSGVRPDLAAYGKAVANGFPLSILGGKGEIMDYIVHPDVSRRPLVAGTYNGHPVPVAAAIATVECLLEDNGALYRRMEELGRMTQIGIESSLKRAGVPGVVSRQGSAFTIYWMKHPPKDWHDILEHHDFDMDLRFRQSMIERGVYFFPVPTKQCSLSFSHTENDIAFTLEQLEEVLKTWPVT
jgi:glutamate-1-semialdehyde 2,1-aminomutase